MRYFPEEEESKTSDFPRGLLGRIAWHVLTQTKLSSYVANHYSCKWENGGWPHFFFITCNLQYSIPQKDIYMFILSYK